jgi:ribosomal protein L32
VKLFEYTLTSEELNECLDCGHESHEYGERHPEDALEADVVCPSCGSIHFYIKEIAE